MRKSLLTILLTSTVVAAQGQVLISLILGDNLNSGKVEFGLEGGLNYSTLTGDVRGSGLPNFNLGFYFDIRMKSNWLLHTGVIVKSNLGSKGYPAYSLSDPSLDNLFLDGSVERNLSYFNVPVTMKYRFTNHFHLEAGTQLGLLYHASDQFQSSVNGSDLRYEIDTFSDYRKLDAGVLLGAGYRLAKGEGVNFSVRYYWGLVDILIDNPGAGIMNRSAYLTVGIPIGAGKAREKRANESK